MGFSQSYRCNHCGLGATVSGGADIGFYARTQTRYCAVCETLVDICTELWCEDLLPELLPAERLKETLDSESQMEKCHHCGTIAETIWLAGHPCPRCGGEVIATGEELLDWD